MKLRVTRYRLLSPSSKPQALSFSRACPVRGRSRFATVGSNGGFTRVVDPEATKICATGLRSQSRSVLSRAYQDRSRSELASTTGFTTGFTLVEILIVIGIITILFGIGLFMTFDVYRGSSFRSERDVVVSLLERARGEALSNINQSPHGFCYDSATKNYVLFEGTDCTDPLAKKELTPASSDVSLTGPLPAGVAFSQLSGDSNWAGDITLTQGTKSWTISINSEGRIEW